MPQGLLHAIRILDISSGNAVAMATQLLAEVGADVIKIESCSGSATRSQPAFAVLNRSKRNVALDIDDAGQRPQLDALLASADVLLHDLTPAQAHQLQLDDASLKQHFPNLIAAAVTGMPIGHPLENMPPLDALVLAQGGLFDTVQASNREGPIYLRFPLGEQCAAYLAAIGVMARLHVRNQGGGVDNVHTSLLQGALTPMLMHWHRAEHPTPQLIPAPKDHINLLLPCADGVWLHIMSSADHCPTIQAECEKLGAETCARLRATNETYMANVPSFPIYRLIFPKRTSREWLDELWAHDVAVDAALDFGQLYFDEQARINGYVVEVDDPQWGKTLQPGLPLSVTPPALIQWPTRALGADTEALLRELGTQPRSPDVPPRTKNLKQPLEGLRVLDLGNFLAGPLAATLMADLGATVIKLEATSGDQMRWGEWAFCGAQRGKRCIALDLKNPESRPVIERLVRWADVVHHNLRMPAAEKLGLGYENLRAINPGIIYCHVSAYGPIGPRRNWPGFDQMMQSAAGWEVLCAGEDNPPKWLRLGMTDHICALSSLLATMLAVYHRDRTGEGQFVRASLLGASALAMAETMARATGEVLPFARLDKNQTGISPQQRIYHCADGWVSLVASADAYTNLLRDFAADSVVALEQGFSRLVVAAALQRIANSGAHGARVTTNDSNFLDDADYQRLGLVARYSHPVYGRFEQVGVLWNFPDMPAKLERSAPTLG
ncbi:MAG: CoA transferase, partial [Spongiibacteraceae bacterium]